MVKKLTLRQVAIEFATLIPAVGVFLADARRRRGDIPLMFQPLNEDGSSGLEHTAEENEGERLSFTEKEILRSREYLIKKTVFYSYHVITAGYLFYGLIKGDFNFANNENYIPLPF